VNFFKEQWAITVTAAMAWLSHIDNYALSVIVNLLTILVILIGLTDWIVRKIKGRTEKKKQEKQERRQVLDLLENTQKPFQTVNMLDNPMGTSEKIGNLFDGILRKIGGIKMKKFFKWLWYNKEQLFSILHNIAVILITNLLMFTDVLAGVIGVCVLPLYVKLIVLAVSLAATVLTVRNVVSKYGLSSLDTIDKELAMRAEAKANKLTDEQKKTLKSYIATLQTTLNKAKEELTTAEKALAEITTLFNADRSLVVNYPARKAELDKTIAQSNAVIANVEAKIAEYKSQLDGKNKPEK
jgi:membrane protein implicated in regulation of membrane protease activity